MFFKLEKERRARRAAGAGGGTRTLTYLRTADFESAAAAITPLRQDMERAKGIEPSWPAWKAGTLPLSYARTGKRGKVYQMCFHSSIAHTRRIYDIILAHG